MADVEHFRVQIRRVPGPHRLLVAEPALRDPNFSRTVVYLIDHNEDGSLGLVLNRPTGLAVEDVVAEWSDHVTGPRVVFTGGPVKPDGALCLARRAPADDRPAGTLEHFQPLTQTLGLMNLHEDPPLGMPGVLGLRVFGGYSGWSAGQLDVELAAGGWFVVDATDDDVFTADPDGLWRRVLFRQGGPLRAVAHFPDNPEVN